ncbi:hypothetical protein MKK88_12140 [Methylobacterium sp. E-005]|uniref:hypothetical protein n=1 Tax=Methylobacterium sp. E-005 TaxID=2836549 RepID=UPI001FBBE408|nr:hypothetical protein [Methylobacterium sp. E-005]MCJ2086737.1 hypothetical protein [Methylobacterium sp. E-005]
MGEIAVPGIFELNPGAVQEFTLNCAGVVYEELGFGEGPIVKSGTRIVSVTCPDVIRELEAVARVGALNRGWRVELAVERLGEFGLDERLARWLLGRSKPPRTFPVRAPGRKRDEDVYVLGVLRKGVACPLKSGPP